MELEPVATKTNGLALWFIVPFFIMLGKLPMSPFREFFLNTISLEHLPKHLRPHLEYVVFIPLSLIVVVLFRLTLGIKIFGVFRPVFIAIAFRIIGIKIGLIFLISVMAAIAVLIPLLRVRSMHSYARVAVILSSVVVLMLATLVVSSWLHVDTLLSVAHFPIISLCLISDSFAKVLYNENLSSAARGAGMTILVAVLITFVSQIPGGMRLLLHFPELLMAQIGCILVVAQYFDFRLFEKTVGAEKKQIDSSGESLVPESPAGKVVEEVLPAAVVDLG